MRDDGLAPQVAMVPGVKMINPMPMDRTGDLGIGLTHAEPGLRLRYEVSRKFAPYVGVSWTWATGQSADYARAQGDRPDRRMIVLGVKSWF